MPWPSSLHTLGLLGGWQQLLHRCIEKGWVIVQLEYNTVTQKRGPNLRSEFGCGHALFVKCGLRNIST